MSNLVRNVYISVSMITPLPRSLRGEAPFLFPANRWGRDAWRDAGAAPPSLVRLTLTYLAGVLVRGTSAQLRCP